MLDTVGKKKIRCHFVPELPPCYVQLGRFGDIMIMLPAMKKIFERSGRKPVMLVCEEFASILEGVSYVDPFIVYGIPWTTGVRRALAAATKYYDRVFVPKWWDCAGMEPPPPPQNEPFTELDIRGRRIIVSQSEWDSYQYSQWKACGFTRQELLDWPLVFDKRDFKRELDLAANHLNPRLPNVLYNFTGVSNPMGFEPEVIRDLLKLRGRVHLVDLGRVKAHRIYDLLGLYDRARCVISGDTATLHLASASRVPLIALLADGGAGSIVKGNEVLRLRYSQIRDNVSQITSTIESLL